MESSIKLEPIRFSLIFNIFFLFCLVNGEFIEINDSDEILIALESNNFNSNLGSFQVENYTNSNSRPQSQWFTQLVDHYNKSDTRPWEQRYFDYGGFHKPEGPVFLHIDGEGSGLLSPLDFIKKGSMAQYAKEQGAYVIALEHRYYGLSFPTSDLSTQNLKYLSIRQAIGDIASFISWFKAHRGFGKNKWVLFGSSYGGSLAKWFSQTHPNMTDILIASSAPLELKYEMPDYLELIGELINKTDSKCYQDLSNGFACLENSVSGQACEGRRYHPHDLKSMFNLCGDLKPQEQDDIAGLFFTIFNTFNNIVVNNIPDPRLNVSLEGVCRKLTNSGNDLPLIRLARVIQEITRASEVSCVEFRLDKITKYLESTSLKSLGSINGDRQFQWQRCNELGWVKGSSNPILPFGSRISTSFHAQICNRIFGLTEEKTRQNIKNADLIYKGKSIPGQCGIYVNGNADPWSRLGVTSEAQVGRCNRVIVIEGASHAKDKGHIQPDISTTLSFPPDLRPAQKQVGKILDSWLKSGKCCEPKSNQGGRILSDRYFYPIPNQQKQSPPSSPVQSSPRPHFKPEQRQQTTRFPPLNLLPIRKSTVPTIKIPNNNDITIDETRRVETRATEDKNQNRINIQSRAQFKELTDYFEKHGNEFFPSETKNISNSEGKRYRVKIRPITQVPRKRKRKQQRPETFAKFGIKMQMTKPVADNNEDFDNSPNNNNTPKELNQKQKPWWLYTDTFEPRKLTNQELEPERIKDELPHDNPFEVASRSRKPKSNRKPLSTKIGDFHEQTKKSESNKDPLQDTQNNENNNSRGRGEKRLVILNLNGKEREVFMNHSENDNIRIRNLNFRKSVLNPAKTVTLKSRNPEEANLESQDKKQEGLEHKPLNPRTKDDSDSNVQISNNHKSSEEEQFKKTEELPVRKVKQIHRKSQSHKIDFSEITINSHEAPLFASKPKSQVIKSQNVNIDVLEDIDRARNRSRESHTISSKKPVLLTSTKISSFSKEEIFIPSERNTNPMVIFKTSNGDVFKSNGTFRTVLKHKSQEIPLQSDSESKAPRSKPKPLTKKSNLGSDENDEYSQTTTEITADTEADSDANDDNDNPCRSKSKQECRGIIFIQNLVRKHIGQNSAESIEKDVDLSQSNESEEVDLSFKPKSHESNGVNIQKVKSLSIEHGNNFFIQSDELFRPKVKQLLRYNDTKSERIKFSDIDSIGKQNRTSSSSPPPQTITTPKNGSSPPPSPKIFVNVKGKEVPVESLDWRDALNPKAQIADLSVTQNSDNLALTGSDVAWVNYGIRPQS